MMFLYFSMRGYVTKMDDIKKEEGNAFLYTVAGVSIAFFTDGMVRGNASSHCQMRVAWDITHIYTHASDQKSAKQLESDVQRANCGVGWMLIISIGK
jgi:hypothetical protein